MFPLRLPTRPEEGIVTPSDCRNGIADVFGIDLAEADKGEAAESFRPSRPLPGRLSQKKGLKNPQKE